MTQILVVHTILSEDPSSVFYSHLRQLTTVCNSRSSELDAL